MSVAPARTHGSPNQSNGTLSRDAGACTPWTPARAPPLPRLPLSLARAASAARERDRFAASSYAAR
eukprot:1903260-Pleurochrysis_carterae.AAC.1